ncbi:NADP-dependent oxidoreductase domain [Dillenia turbinata]|uniref:NADP-dependent oxidoreductase domain n=1 Tax=Dillenia turbinata TaxID=194707 RepID=A0AAN8VPB9_9MAGN
MEIPSVVLSSSDGSRSMPLIGMGTAVHVLDEQELKSAVIKAIKVGYRNFDSAKLYRSEKPLGEAIAEALKLGLVQSRDELFIATKLWCTDAHRDLVVPALHQSLKNLQLEYVDQYLIHWPISAKPGICKFPIDKEELLPMDFRSVWAAMEDCQRLGLTKSIGVCNFSCAKLETLLAHATIPPSVNQVELSPVWQQKKLREFCEAKGIIVVAYSPLGAKGMRWGTNQVMDCQVLKEIAEARGKTLAQVSLRWIYEQGAGLVVRSFKEERMKENISIFDWSLSKEDYDKINQIKQQRGMPKMAFVSPNGPYKSLQQLWDGEI